MPNSIREVPIGAQIEVSKRDVSRRGNAQINSSLTQRILWEIYEEDSRWLGRATSPRASAITLSLSCVAC